MTAESELAGFVARGTGKTVRNVALAGPEDLDRPEVGALLDAALPPAKIPMDASRGPELIVTSGSEKQRPRR